MPTISPARTESEMPSSTRKTDVVRGGQAVDLERRGVSFDLGPLERRAARRLGPHHHLGHVLGGKLAGPALTCELPAAEYGHVVGVLGDLTELVGDDGDADSAVLGHPPQHAEHLVGLLRE